MATETGDAEAGGGDSAVPTPEAGEAGDSDEQQPPRFSLPCEDGATISVTRRLYRNGDSDYRINGTRCRLKDLQNLLRAASIGARTYAVIERQRRHHTHEIRYQQQNPPAYQRFQFGHALLHFF